MREIKKFDGFAAHPSTTARRSLGGPDGTGAGCAPPFWTRCWSALEVPKRHRAWMRLAD